MIHVLDMPDFLPSKQKSRANIFEFMRKEKIIILMYFISIIFFMYQFHRSLAWDFAVYILNAKYLFAGGHFFEIIRPPLTSFFLGIFGLLFGFTVAPYVYIIFSATLHLASAITLSRVLNIDKTVFYVFSITPFFLLYGLQQGSELLSLSILQFFFASVFSRKNSGIYLALSVLTRYNNAFFVILLMFRKAGKDVAKDVLTILVLFLPWFAYNLAITGEPFRSFMAYYSLNVFSRASIAQPINPIHIIFALGFIAPLFFAGFFWAVSKKTLKNKENLAMLIFKAIVLFAYYVAPFKDQRFIFALILPIAYFSERAVAFYSLNHVLKNTLLMIIIVLNISTSLFVLISSPTEIKGAFDVSLSLDKNCTYMSNYWVYLNYYGLKSFSSPDSADISRLISEGQRMVFFKNVGDPPYAENRTFLRSFDVIGETEEYIILGNKGVCSTHPEKIM